MVDINGSGDTKASAKRIAKHLHRKYTEAFEEFLEEEKLVVPGQMNEVAVAAMFAAGGVTGKRQRCAILRVLRYNFGKKAFATEARVQLLCEGATEVLAGSVDYAHDQGDMTEKVTFTQKNIAREVEAQVTVSVVQFLFYCIDYEMS